MRRLIARRGVALSIATVLMLNACTENSSTPAAPPVMLPAVANTAAATTPTFAWLAPLGTGAPDPATFDATAAPTVEICVWNSGSCVGSPVARFSTTPANPVLPLTANAAVGQYQADWSLLSTAFTTRKTYRIRTLKAGIEIGAVSVDVVRGRWALTRTDGTLAPLTSAIALPIRFSVAQMPRGRRATIDGAIPAGITSRVTSWSTAVGDVAVSAPLPSGADGLLFALDARGGVVFAATIPAGSGDFAIDVDALALGELRGLASSLSGSPVTSWPDAAFIGQVDFSAFRSNVIAALNGGQVPLDAQNTIQLALSILRPVLGQSVLPVIGPSRTVMPNMARIVERSGSSRVLGPALVAAPVSLRFGTGGVYVTNPTTLTYATTIRRTGVPSDPGVPGPNIVPNANDVLLVNASTVGEFTIDIGSSAFTNGANAQALASAFLSTFEWALPTGKSQQCLTSSMAVALGGDSRWLGYVAAGDLTGAIRDFSVNLSSQGYQPLSALQTCLAGEPNGVANALFLARLIGRNAIPVLQAANIFTLLWNLNGTVSAFGDLVLGIQYVGGTGSVSYCSSGSGTTSGACGIAKLIIGAPGYVLTGQAFDATVTVEGPGGSTLFGRPVAWSASGNGTLADASNFGSTTTVNTVGVGSTTIFASVGGQTAAATIDVTDLSDPNGGRGSTNPYSMFRTWTFQQYNQPIGTLNCGAQPFLKQAVLSLSAGVAQLTLVPCNTGNSTLICAGSTRFFNQNINGNQSAQVLLPTVACQFYSGFNVSTYFNTIANDIVLDGLFGNLGYWR